MTDRAEDIACSQANGRVASQSVVQSRRRGAPVGNQNRLVHGCRSRASIERRKEAAAAIKACALMLSKLGMLDGRCRYRPLRPDQLRFIPPEWIPAIAPYFVQPAAIINPIQNSNPMIPISR